MIQLITFCFLCNFSPRKEHHHYQNVLVVLVCSYMIWNVHFTKFQALLRCGILIWGGIGGELNTRMFRIQKRVIRSVVGVSSRTSCRQLFKELNILTLASLYIYWKWLDSWENIFSLWSKLWRFINVIHEERWISMLNCIILKYTKRM